MGGTRSRKDGWGLLLEETGPQKYGFAAEPMLTQYAGLRARGRCFLFIFARLACRQDKMCALWLTSTLHLADAGVRRLAQARYFYYFFASISSCTKFASLTTTDTMKQLFSLVAALLMAAVAQAQGVIQFEKELHDFGNVPEGTMLPTSSGLKTPATSPSSSPTYRPAAAAPHPTGPRRPCCPARLAS